MRPFAFLLVGLTVAGVLVARPGAGWAQERSGRGGDAAAPLRIPGGALERPLRFGRLTVADGLSQGEVLDLHQDRRGFMWVATLNGLNRYDGYEVKVYAPVPFDTTALADGVVNAVYEDRAGAIWAGTAYVGLARLDPATETFTHYAHDPDDPHSLGDGEVTAVFEDRDGALWVGTGSGLSRMDPDRPGRFTRFAHDPADVSTLSHGRVRSIGEDAEGALWVATADGLNRMEPGAPGRFRRFLTGAGAGSSLHRQLGVGDVRWVGSDRGLVRFDAATGEARRFLPHPDRPDANVVRAASPDPWTDGVLWLAVLDEGLTRFDTVSETFTHYPIDAESPTGLVEHAGTLVYTDRAGVVWVGSQGGGLNTFDPATVGFAHYGAASGGRRGLRNPSVWGLHVTRDGAVWAGTSEGYLHRISPETGEVRVWEADPEGLGPARPSGEANAFAEAADGTFWIGTTDGLSRYDPASDTFTHHVHDADDAASLSSSNVLDLLLDRDGVLWVATASGLNRHEPAPAPGGGGAFTRYPLDPSDPDARVNWVSHVVQTHDGAIWVAADGAVGRLDEAAGRFETVGHDPADPATLTSGAYGWLHERAREPGVLWVAGLSGGLDRLDTRTGEVRHYTAETSELPDNTVYAVLEDGAGRLWLSTNRGLARFDPEERNASRAFRRFGLASGLQSLEFSQHAAATDAEGRLYFGGVEGINVFHPEAVEGNPVPPQVAFTGLRISNEPVAPGPGSPLERSLAETDAVELGYDQRNVTVEYVGLHYKNPARNRYRYRLDGFDEGWVEADTRRQAAYTNLPPGDYTFLVRAANADGVWGGEGRALALTVRPPWWGSTWAFGVYALLLGAGVVAVDRVQRRRLVARERERTRERERAQAREIERAYTELRAAKDRLVQQEKMASLGALTAGIAHEIKNPLNFVTGFAGLSRELVDELAGAGEADRDEILADLRHNTAKIEEHGRRADAIVRSMMEHARSGTGERRPVDLNALVAEYAGHAEHAARARHPGFEPALALALADDVGVAEVVPQEIGRVVVNLVHNALDAVRQRAGTGADAYTPTVTVSTARVGGDVEVRVEDNGPGLAPDVAARVFEPFYTTKPTGQGHTGLGLSLAHDIVTNGHRGTLAVESEEGAGATFVLTLSAPARAEALPQHAPAP